MSKNKYRRRRAMRTPTAGVKYQNEPLQGAIQQTTQGSTFNDLGREDARRITEANNPNTRYVDKPQATTNKRALTDVMSRQQAAIREMQRQVLGSKAVPQLKPAGKFAAPSVPPQSPLVFQGGSVRFQPAVRGNLALTVAGVASQMLVQPLSDAISDNVINPLLSAAFGKEVPTMEEIRRLQRQQEQDDEQVRTNDATDNDTHPETSPESSSLPLNPIEDVDAQIEDSTPLEATVEGVEESHSTSPEDDERNREYLIRRAALGDNPTKEEMDTVVAYGLEQHRLNFPHLYK